MEYEISAVAKAVFLKKNVIVSLLDGRSSEIPAYQASELFRPATL